MRARLVLIPAVVALAVVTPWLVRDWLVFGSPLPGQAVTNAWTITGFEIFAWKEPATLAGYLAAGPVVWLGDRVGGFAHNLMNVLVLPGMPIAAVGLAGLPWVARSRALRLLVVSAIATFVITTLAFPVQTTWGTYLHASAPADVLIIVSGLSALDVGLAWIGRRRAWTRPVAWLGPLFAGAGALPLDPSVPVISNHPIWVAEADRVRALALPDEPVSSVLEIARTFGARYVVLDGEAGGWPARLATDLDAHCLAPVALPDAGTAPDPFRVYRVACP
jgi:hypothetical protein